MIPLCLFIIAACLGYLADGVPGVLAGFGSIAVFIIVTVVGTWMYKRGTNWAILHLALMCASIPATIWAFYTVGGR